MPASVVAWTSILHAVEHLDAFRDHWTASPCRYPTAHYSLLRSALIDGAVALWILGPEDALQRRTRALTVAIDDMRNLRKVAAPARVFVDDPAPIDQKVADIEARLRVATAAATRCEMPGGDRADKWRVETTAVIKEAGAYLPRDDTADRMSAAALMLWHTQSQTIHGAPSARLNLVDPATLFTTADGTRAGPSTIDYDTLLPALGAAVLYTSQALAHFHRRARRQGC